jgi:uncharacterized protein YkwD
MTVKRSLQHRWSWPRLPSLLLAGVAASAACGSGAHSSSSGDGGVDPAVQHNLDQLNYYRAQAGVAPLQLSTQLDQFATAGDQALAAGGQAHAHFHAAGQDGSLWTSGFCHNAGENQAPGWPVSDENATVDAILKSMMDEGPGGGHHDNIVNPQFRLVGIGLIDQGGLYLTNDFSAACP